MRVCVELCGKMDATVCVTGGAILPGLSRERRVFKMNRRRGGGEALAVL